MYVFFLACAFFTVMALQEHRAILVIAVSLAVYCLAQIGLSAGIISQVKGAFVQSTWQFLFIAGMVVGWEWKSHVLPFVRSRTWQLLAVTGLGTLLFFSLAHAPKIPYLRDVGLDLWPYFEKYRLDPAVIVYFVCLISVLGAAVAAAWKLRPARPVLRLFALYGRHSLGCFVILSLVQLGSWIVATPAEPEGGRHLAWFALALILFAIYAIVVERIRSPQPAMPLASPRPL
jgi:hypothetical protein